MGSIPARFPPPFEPQDALAVPGDADPIEVGILVVGAGPAGLACAIRLGQLVEEDPATAERLGDVPVAVLEKGKQPGSHLLSGAVVNPRGLQRLFKGRKRIDELPFLGEVAHESVYFMTPKHSFRIPTPPSMRNHGNYVASRLAARPVPRAGGRGGRRDDPARDARGKAARPGRARPRRPHRRPWPWPERRAAAELRARLGRPRPGDRARRGNAGPPDGRRDPALRASGREPAGLGARRQGGLARQEAARPRDPHDGLAAAERRQVPGVRRLVRLPDGRGHGHDRDGRRARLPRHGALGSRPAPGAEDAQADPRDPRAAASGWSGARRRSPRAGSCRCRGG